MTFFTDASKHWLFHCHANYLMTINLSVETVNTGELNGHTLILIIWKTMLRVKPHKKQELYQIEDCRVSTHFKN